MSKISVVIPAYEPDERLIELLNALDQKDIGPIYIVNDGSGPQYDPVFEKATEIIEKSGGKLLRHEINRGKGRALKTAFSYILENDDETMAVVTADSDGQHTPECISKIIHAVRNNRNSLILGVRNFDGHEIPWKSQFGNKLTEKIFQYVTGTHITDTQTGLRGIPRAYMNDLLSISGERFEYEMRMLLDACEKIRIVEVPVKTVYDSVGSHQTHFHPLKDSVRIYRILGKKMIRYILSSLLSSLLDLTIFSVCCAVLKSEFPGSVIYIPISIAIARVISAACNYLINYKIVFKSEKEIGLSAFKYAVLVVVQMLFSAISVTALVSIIPYGKEIIYKVIVDTVLFFASYYIQQKKVF